MSSWRGRWPAAATTAWLLTQVSCGGPESQAPTPDTTLVVSPAIAAAAPNVTVAFTATPVNGVTWRVNGIPAGNAQLGTVSMSGLYTGPAQIPAGDSVLIEAALAGDTTVRGSAKVFFIPNLTDKDYYAVLPRVVDATRPRPMRFLVVPAPSVATITSSVAGLASPIGLGVHTFVLDSARAVAGYVTGTLHNTVGTLDYRDAAGALVKLANLSVNVRDADMPDVVITSLVPYAQRSPYVLNLRVDTATIGPSSEIVSRALQLLGGDLFDFVAVVATVSSNNNRSYYALRNDVQGIGVSPFDNSDSWGGTGRLRGTIAFPLDALFDGAEAGMIHEMGHAWINFASNDPILNVSIPHWPPSTMAHYVMGFNIPGTSVGGHFQWSLTWLGNGTVRVNVTPDTDHYAPLDLYLMGLLPPDSVPAMYVLSPSVDPRTLSDGVVVPATAYAIGDYIAAQGPRVPASASSRQVAAAVVVLTYGRLLTPTEMAFFDYASARAETTVPLQSQTGLVKVIASGFDLATGGRATLKTRLP